MQASVLPTARLRCRFHYRRQVRRAAQPYTGWRSPQEIDASRAPGSMMLKNHSLIAGYLSRVAAEGQVGTPARSGKPPSTLLWLHLFPLPCLSRINAELRGAVAAR